MNNQKTISVGGVSISNDLPFTLFGGMNVLESRDLAMEVASTYKSITDKLGIPLPEQISEFFELFPLRFRNIGEPSL